MIRIWRNWTFILVAALNYTYILICVWSCSSSEIRPEDSCLRTQFNRNEVSWLHSIEIWSKISIHFYDFRSSFPGYY